MKGIITWAQWSFTQANKCRKKRLQILSFC
jgi:hypothetical protein